MMLLKQNLREIAVMLLCFGVLTACATRTPSAGTEAPGGPSAFCLVAKPIIFSRLHDTPETIAQVKAHNAQGQALCGWQGTGP